MGDVKNLENELPPRRGTVFYEKRGSLNSLIVSPQKSLALKLKCLDASKSLQLFYKHSIVRSRIDRRPV